MKNKIYRIGIMVCILLTLSNTYHSVYASDLLNTLSDLTLSSPRLLAKFESLKRIESAMDEKTITLVGSGDIMFHTPQMTSAFDKNTGIYDFTPPFSEVAPYIQIADYALANFETTTSGEAYTYSGYPAFNAPDETLDAIKAAGFDYLSTSNNHSFDRKLEGVYRTLDQIDSRDLDHGGTYHATDEPKRYMVKEVGAFKLGILSLTYGLNGFEKAYEPETLFENVNLISPEADPQFVETQLKLMENEGLDFSIVFVHWGNEYQLEPNEAQKQLAHQMIEWGADIILGSHPHVIQQNEIYEFNGEDKYIIYSMGNFLSNQSRKTLSNKNAVYTEDGVLVYLTLSKNELQKPFIKSVKHVPTWVYKYPSNGRTNYRILPSIEYLSDSILTDESTSNTDPLYAENIIEWVHDSYKRTMNKLTDYPQKLQSPFE